MATNRIIWKDGDRNTEASFRIPYVGELTIQVESELPGSGTKQTEEERRALAIRHAQLLIRNLANELDRQAA